jgi:hypothetical protein
MSSILGINIYFPANLNRTNTSSDNKLSYYHTRRLTPGNAFVSKCETYLRQGIGLAIIDVVTGRKANLHDELLIRLVGDNALLLNTDLYAVSYRPIERNGQPSLDIWQKEISVGKALPTLPLWLHGEICLPVDLYATYERTCREQRIVVI